MLFPGIHRLCSTGNKPWAYSPLVHCRPVWNQHACWKWSLLPEELIVHSSLPCCQVGWISFPKFCQKHQPLVQAEGGLGDPRTTWPTPWAGHQLRRGKWVPAMSSLSLDCTLTAISSYSNLQKKWPSEQRTSKWSPSPTHSMWQVGKKLHTNSQSDKPQSKMNCKSPKSWPSHETM